MFQIHNCLPLAHPDLQVNYPWCVIWFSGPIKGQSRTKGRTKLALWDKGGERKECGLGSFTLPLLLCKQLLLASANLLYFITESDVSFHLPVNNVCHP